MIDLFDAVLAERRPAAPAVRERSGRVTTYGELREGALRVAEQLSRWGLRLGDGVLLATRPSARALMAALGIVKVGGVVILADPGAGQALADARRHVAPAKAAVADTLVHAASSRLGQRLLRAIPAASGLQLPDLTDPSLRHIVSGPRLPGVPPSVRWESLPAGPDRPGPGRVADALVVFTSGSTELPRAVVHTNDSLGYGIGVAAEALGFDESTVLSSDQLMLALPVLAAGGRWSLTPVPSSESAWMRQARRDGATHLYAVPKKILGVLDRVPSTVRWIGMGGAPVLPAAVSCIREAVPGAAIRAIYGMTEALPIAVATGEEVLASPPDAVVVGAPVGGIEVSVDDGELLVRGRQVRDRYALHEADPIVRTGDLGYLAGGRIHLSGRAKRMLIRGHVNIYPDLVEPLLLQRFEDEISDAAIVGQSDPVSGDERVVLLIVPRRGSGGAGRAILREWTSLADEGWRPDEVREVEAIARRGRSNEVDLDTLGLEG